MERELTFRRVCELTLCFKASEIARVLGLACALEVADRNRNELLTNQPTCAREPTPDERLPPRKTRTKLLRTAKRTPNLNWICDTPMIESENPTLELLPTTTNHELPTPGGLLYFFNFFHHFFIERN